MRADSTRTSRSSVVETLPDRRSDGNSSNLRYPLRRRNVGLPARNEETNGAEHIAEPAAEAIEEDHVAAADVGGAEELAEVGEARGARCRKHTAFVVRNFFKAVFGAIGVFFGLNKWWAAVQQRIPLGPPLYMSVLGALNTFFETNAIRGRGSVAFPWDQLGAIVAWAVWLLWRTVIRPLWTLYCEDMTLYEYVSWIGHAVLSLVMWFTPAGPATLVVQLLLVALTAVDVAVDVWEFCYGVSHMHA